MSATQEDVKKVARAICRDVPVTKLADMLKLFQESAATNDCGGGCACGGGCKNSVDLTFDESGHTEISAAILNDIGKNRMNDLKKAVAGTGADISNSIESN
ncbi:MAG: hypothetical protein AAF827_00075 [Cyanobacteria bacterium P01_D01_bin.6]